MLTSSALADELIACPVLVNGLSFRSEPPLIELADRARLCREHQTTNANNDGSDGIAGTAEVWAQVAASAAQHRGGIEVITLLQRGNHVSGHSDHNSRAEAEGWQSWSTAQACLLPSPR